jgi:MFS family permease
MGVYRTPAVAYMPDVTEKPLRSKGNAIINLVGYIGGIFTSVVIMFMLKSEKDASGKSVYVSGQSFFPVFAVIAAFMLISVLIMVLTVNENKVLKETNIRDEEEQNTGKGKKLEKGVAKSLFFILASVFLWFMAYNGVTTTFSRYCLNVLNVDLSTSSSYMLTATITAIIAFVPLGFLSSKIGRKKTILIGVAVMTACLFGAHFITGQTPMLFVILGVIGVAWAAINVNSFPMVVEMSSGADVGKYTGIYYTFSMAAQITTPVLSGFIIDNLGFGYKALFPYAVIFAFASFVTMCFVKHGDSKPEPRKSVLESFDTED